MNKLPAELIAFLEESSSLVIVMDEGEIRQAELLSLSELKLERFRVESDYDDEGEAKYSEDFEGFSLLKSAGDYQPNGVLVWLTDLKQYGAWDCDHLDLITFLDVTWTDIMVDPTWYINGQWYPDRIEHRKIKLGQ